MIVLPGKKAWSWLDQTEVGKLEGEQSSLEGTYLSQRTSLALQARPCNLLTRYDSISYQIQARIGAFFQLHGCVLVRHAAPIGASPLRRLDHVPSYCRTLVQHQSIALLPLTLLRKRWLSPVWRIPTQGPRLDSHLAISRLCFVSWMGLESTDGRKRALSQ